MSEIKYRQATEKDIPKIVELWVSQCASPNIRYLFKRYESKI